MLSLSLIIDPGRLPSAELRDFPLYVRLRHDALRHESHGGYVRLKDGRDIRFVSGSRSTPLACELSEYDPTDGSIEAWVRIPRLSRKIGRRLDLLCGGASADTFGSPPVWDNDYRLIVHDPRSPQDASTDARGLRKSGAAVRAKASPDLDLTGGYTVEAWVDDPDGRAEALQALVSQWTPSRSLRGFSGFDAGDTDGLDARGYLGAAFDGRYAYFAPQANTTLRANGTRRHGIALRYDTHGAFDSRRSWRAFDAGNTDGLNTKGYYGGIFDGRYVYFTPRYDGVDYHSRVLRYDTRSPFGSPDSWSAYDAGLPISYQSACFDGRFIYFCPGHTPDREQLKADGARYNTATSHGGSGKVIRYDTRSEFKEPGSWVTYDAAGTDDLPTAYFDGAVFDGRYVHFVPLYHKAPMRYDTHGDFADSGSWSASDASKLGMDMCVGAVFDGTFIYFVPYRGNIVVRYDTRGDYGSRRSWRRYKLQGIRGLSRRGWDGAVFDGKYVYFIPYWSGTENAHRVTDYFHGVMLRYDASRPFDESGSWAAVDAGHTDGLDTRGYNGAAFDGRFIYCAAWEKGEGDTTNIKGHGNFLRYDTLGDRAGFSLRYCDLGHNGGLISALPGARFIVNTDRGAVNVSADRPPAPGLHHIAGVFDGKRIALYIDGRKVKSRAVRGQIRECEQDVAINGILNGLGQCRGKVSEVRISSVPRPADYLRTQHANLSAPEAFITVEPDT